MKQTKRMYCRRRFLTRMSSAFAGSVLGSRLGCNSAIASQNLPFAGQFVGESYAIGHLYKDGKLKIDGVTEDQHIYDVVIAGGGVSGLSTAWTLSRAGKNNYLLLEKEATFGGHCLGGIDAGLTYCLGAHYGWYPEPHMKYLIALYADCGVISSIDADGYPVIKPQFLLDPDHLNNLYVNGQWLPDDWPWDIASDADNKAYTSFMDEVGRLNRWRDKLGRPAFGFPLSTISQHPEIRGLDNISMATYLQQKGYRSKLLDWHINSWMIDEYGTPMDRLSAWAGLQYFREINFPAAQKGRADMLSWPQGLAYMTTQMAAHMPAANGRQGVFVLRMENDDGLVKTTYYDTKTEKLIKVRSRHGVFAIPKNQVYHLIPRLKQSGRVEFNDLVYSPWLVAGIHLRRLPDYGSGEIKWENTIFESWTMGYINNHYQERPKRRADQPHVITMYVCFPEDPQQARQKMLHTDWQTWAFAIVKELERAHPDIRPLISKIDIVKWGHAMRQTLPGQVFGPGRMQMLQPFGNILFGHVDVCGIPVFEETVYRGIEVAEKILDANKVNFDRLVS